MVSSCGVKTESCADFGVILDTPDASFDALRLGFAQAKLV
jgi:hypothetical protein